MNSVPKPEQALLFLLYFRRGNNLESRLFFACESAGENFINSLTLYNIGFDP